MIGKINGLTLVGLAFMVLILFSVLSDQAMSQAQALPTPSVISLQPEIPAEEPARENTAEIFAAPYKEYIVTQGPHGFSYGHAAIDLTGGQGAEILSPINGTITANFVDDIGNTTLWIENERYLVTMLHGDYPLAVETQVEAGQVIGTESNHGYTVDWQGRLCAGRDCGYHTHLNVYDKSQGQNVNPLELIP